MHPLKKRLLFMFCFMMGCSRTVDVTPPISTELPDATASSATPSTEATPDIK